MVILDVLRDALPWWNTFLVPHNEHWSTIPLLEYHILRHFFGIGSYWPYIGILIFSHLITAHIVWRVAVSVGVSGAIATGLVAAFAVAGAGSENLLWAFQIELRRPSSARMRRCAVGQPSGSSLTAGMRPRPACWRSG